MQQGSLHAEVADNCYTLHSLYKSVFSLDNSPVTRSDKTPAHIILKSPLKNLLSQ